MERLLLLEISIKEVLLGWITLFNPYQLLMQRNFEDQHKLHIRLYLLGINQILSLHLYKRN